MNIRKIVAGAALVGTMALGASIAAAQDTTPPERPGAIRALIEIVAEETGLERQEIIAQVREGTPLADIITANGGHIDVVIDAAVREATERINAAVSEGRMTQEQADRLLANLEDMITRGINGELTPNCDGQRPGVRMQAAHILLQATAAETGLDEQDIRQQLRSGSTLADIITANGGSVENVVASAVADATEQINNAVESGRLTQEQADDLLASLETSFTDAVNRQLPERDGHPGEHLFARGIARQVAEATGLEVADVVQQLRDGATIADILTANGVDVDTFTNNLIASASERLAQAVANGRISQERADEMIARLTEQLPEIINSSRPAEGSI